MLPDVGLIIKLLLEQVNFKAMSLKSWDHVVGSFSSFFRQFFKKKKSHQIYPFFLLGWKVFGFLPFCPAVTRLLNLIAPCGLV